MAGTILLADMECLSDSGYLHQYKRKSDGALFSVQTLITNDDSQPQFHPNILSLENLSKFSHPNLAKYHGYALKSVEEQIHILIFLEDSKGSLADYIKDNELTNEEASNLAQELADALMFIDKSTNTLPLYLTPSSVMITEDANGNHHFKVFRTLFFDSMGRNDEDDFKWMAPELYERAKFEKFNIVINTEKCVLYSVGLLVLFAVAGEVIGKGREEMAMEQYPKANSKREKDLVTSGLEKIYLRYSDSKLNETLRNMLAYNDKKRPDFQSWQVKYRTLGNNNLDISLQQADQFNDSKYGWFNDGAVMRVSRVSVANGKKSATGGKAAAAAKRDECLTCSIF